MNGFIKIKNIRFQLIRLLTYSMLNSTTIRFYFIDMDLNTEKEFIQIFDFEMNTQDKALLVINSIDDDFKSGSKFIDVDKTLELLNGDG